MLGLVLVTKEKLIEDIISVPKGLRTYWRRKINIVWVNGSVMGTEKLWEDKGEISHVKIRKGSQEGHV